MPGGFIQRSASGAVMFDSAIDSAGKALGEFTVGAGGGSLTDGRLLAGKGFVFPKTPYQFGTTRTFTFSGATLSWDAQTIAGPTAYIYAVGKANNPAYVSTHVPGTAGFFARDDNGNFMLDETFFTYHFLAKVTASVAVGNNVPIVVPFPYNNLPPYAIRSDVYVTPLSSSVNSGGQNVLVVRAFGTGTVEIYFFGKVPSLGSGGGMRWWSNSGELMGDTSIPMLNIVDTLPFSGSMWGGPDRYLAGARAGRRYAVMMHSPGRHYQVFQGSGGQTGGGTTRISVAAGRVITSGDQDFPSVAEQLLQEVTSGGAAQNLFVDGSFSLIDVTGM